MKQKTRKKKQNSPRRHQDAALRAPRAAGHARSAAPGPEPAYERRLPRRGRPWCWRGPAALGRGTGTERSRALQGTDGGKVDADGHERC